MKNKTWLLLGSNIGNPLQQLSKARKYIQKGIGKICRESSIYTTAAWGKNDQPDFLNQVIVVETSLTAMEAMKTILSIEQKMGRVRTKKNAPRLIDIDILFYNKEIHSDKMLSVPHPLLQERRFVLVPLNELSPNLIHPVLRKTTHRLLTECTDPLPVKKN